MTTDGEPKDPCPAAPREARLPPDWGQVLTQALDGALPDTPALETMLDRWSGERRG
ncbi:hypothetical protein [Rhodosalinus sp.]|uniref:hypothetical protein n=1 Tax=Rhodosalinus sp. TaxID=2047741 RepID=UPI00397C1828